MGSYIEAIKFSETIKSIGISAFENCINLKEIEIPKLVSGISNSVFQNCISLEKIILHDDIKSIGLDTFSNCKMLKYIVIPASVTLVRKAFLHCENLTIYYEGESIPNTWDQNWNYHNCSVYLKGEWEYTNGIPAPILKNN
jgi:hypothetical protein